MVAVVPRLSRVLWTRWAAPLTVVVAAVGQALVEGAAVAARPPAYGLTLALRTASAVRGRVGRPLRLAASAVGLVVPLISVALPVAVPVFRFAKPSRPDAIGTVTYAWTDGSRPELFTSDPDDHRELVAQVWYSAVDDPSAPQAAYSPDVAT